MPFYLNRHPLDKLIPIIPVLHTPARFVAPPPSASSRCSSAVPVYRPSILMYTAPPLLTQWGLIC